MSFALSLLDKSPVAADATGTDAIKTSIRYAQLAERLGYKRIWFAEHHGNAGLAGTAPEILAAAVAVQTSHIRIGTGGILLQHYSPFKVAEVAKALNALAPGRIDLGIGKAPGGLPATARALQTKHDVNNRPGIDAQIRDLDGFLDGTLPAEHRHGDAVAHPQTTAKIERFLLGASADSADLASELGWNFTFAGHFNGDPQAIETSFDRFRKATGRSPSLALYAFAAPSAEEARAAVAHVKIFRLSLPDGRRLNVGSVEQAEEFARQAGVSSYELHETPPSIVAGDPDQVRAELSSISRRFGVEEFIIDSPVAEPAARLASIELIAAASRLRVAA